MNRILLFCIFILLLNSCAKSVDNEIDFYSNDFETGSLTGIRNGKISPFASTNVLGNYNNDGFDLTLNALPKHNVVDITFDLYIHDSWTGNMEMNDNQIGPEIWQLKVNNKTFISTTFSNLECIPGNICPPQSYPADYPNNNHNPKFAALKTNLPGFCKLPVSSNGSTLYRIHKIINDTDKVLFIQLLDKINQKTFVDTKCDASWSVDNIKIKLINYN